MKNWKKLMNPDYLGGYALAPGQDLIVTIKTVGNEEVTSPDGKKSICSVIHFAEDVKPMILNATNNRVECLCKRNIDIFADIIITFRAAYIFRFI